MAYTVMEKLGEKLISADGRENTQSGSERNVEVC